MKEILKKGELREVHCINTIAPYQEGNTYAVFIQVLRDVNGIAVFSPSIPNSGYRSFESPSEFLSYFSVDPKLEERLKNIENDGFVYTPDIV